MFSKAFLEELRRDAERVRSPQAESTPVPEGFLLPTFGVPELTAIEHVAGDRFVEVCRSVYRADRYALHLQLGPS